MVNGNKIKGEGMDILVNSLPWNNSGTNKELYIYDSVYDHEENICYESQVAIAKSKGWLPLYWVGRNGIGWAEYSGIPDPVDVATIILKESETMHLGATLQLTAIVKPENATNKAVTWSSSNESVATVSSDGIVTAKTLGTAIITCTAKDGSGIKATCQVTVEPVKVISVALNTATATLEKGKTMQLIAYITPNNATNKDVSWSASPSSVASVDNKGKVTALEVGTATITCKSQDGSEVKAMCQVTVVPTVVAVNDITLNATTKTLFVGQEFSLSATVLPTNATEKSVSWSSDKEDVASVDAYGHVTAKAVGKAEITCTANDGSGVRERCSIIVEAVPVTRIILNHSEATLEAGETTQLIATVEPDNATDKSVMWSSNKPSVASVDVNGIVTANSSGLALITCAANDGNGVEEKCLITVIVPEPTKIDVVPATLKIDIEVSNTFRLSYVLTPSNAVTAVTWQSDDESIATVTQDGVVTCLKDGTVHIYAETSNHKWGSCTINITDAIQDVKADSPQQLNSTYSITGQCLAAPRKGINIVNGKKVFVK